MLNPIEYLGGLIIFDQPQNVGLHKYIDIYSSSIWWLRFSPSKYKLSTFADSSKPSEKNSLQHCWDLQNRPPSAVNTMAFCWRMLELEGAKDSWNFALELYFFLGKSLRMKKTQRLKTDLSFVVFCVKCWWFLKFQPMTSSFKHVDIQRCFQNLHNVKYTVLWGWWVWNP